MTRETQIIGLRVKLSPQGIKSVGNRVSDRVGTIIRTDGMRAIVKWDSCKSPDRIHPKFLIVIKTNEN